SFHVATPPRDGTAPIAAGWRPSGVGAPRAEPRCGTPPTSWRTPCRRLSVSDATSMCSWGMPVWMCSAEWARCCGSDGDRVTLAAGVDIGGTKCLGVVLDDAGHVVREERSATPKGPDAVLDVVEDLAGRLHPYDSLGLGAAGLVTRDGLWRAAP